MVEVGQSPIDDEEHWIQLPYLHVVVILVGEAGWGVHDFDFWNPSWSNHFLSQAGIHGVSLTCWPESCPLGAFSCNIRGTSIKGQVIKCDYTVGWVCVCQGHLQYCRRDSMLENMIHPQTVLPLKLFPGKIRFLGKTFFGVLFTKVILGFQTIGL
jgi:hypothetical protein